MSPSAISPCVLQSGQFNEDMIPTVGFNMRKITKGNVTIKVRSSYCCWLGSWGAGWSVGAGLSLLLQVKGCQQPQLQLGGSALGCCRCPAEEVVGRGRAAVRASLGCQVGGLLIPLVCWWG